jgi:uncharacterized protein
MKNVVLGLLLCILMAPAGFAQQNAADAPASKEDIEKFMAVTQKRELAIGMMANVKKQMHQVAADQLKKDPSLGAGWVESMDKIFEDVWKNFPVDDMLEAQVPVYQKHFSHADIEALLAFYVTPVGRKVIAEMPAINAESMQAIMPLVQKMTAKATERLQQEVAQAQKSGGGNSPNKPQTN